MVFHPYANPHGKRADEPGKPWLVTCFFDCVAFRPVTCGQVLCGHVSTTKYRFASETRARRFRAAPTTCPWCGAREVPGGSAIAFQPEEPI